MCEAFSCMAYAQINVSESRFGVHEGPNKYLTPRLICSAGQSSLIELVAVR